MTKFLISNWRLQVPLAQFAVLTIVSACGGNGAPSPEISLPASSIELIAGTAGVLAEAGAIDGPVAQARFRTISDIAVDASGNVLVADGSRIRRITRSGVVETITDVLPIAVGVAIDSAGTAYAISFDLCGPPQHTCNSRLYRIDAGGQKTLVCEWAFFFPGGILIDPSGNFLVNGLNEGTFRVSRDCTQTRIALPGPERRGIALDAAGNIFVADTGSQQVLKIAPSGEVTTFAGKAGEAGYVNDIGGAARFTSPTDVAVDSLGNVYVSDFGNSVIRKITPAGAVSTVAGTPGLSGFLAGRLPGVLAPTCVAVVGSDLYVGVGTGIVVIHNRP